MSQFSQVKIWGPKFPKIGNVIKAVSLRGSTVQEASSSQEPRSLYKRMQLRGTYNLY